MPTIEDVDYLKKNSIKQNYIFLIDSKDRNKEAYPNPSEYIVEFSAPFQNVIGLSVIDASIPRTMYNIDVYNNELYFLVHSSNYDLSRLSFDSFKKATLEPGDYTIQTLITELNTKLQMNLNNDSNLPFVKITSSPLSNPPDLKNRIAFSSAYPFIFNMKDSSLAETLGFDAYIRLSEYNKADYDRNYNPFRFDKYPGVSNLTIDIYQQFRRNNYTLQEVIKLNNNSNVDLINYVNSLYANNQLFHSVDIPFSNFSNNLDFINTNSYTLLQGPQGVIRQEPLLNQIAQRFYVPYTTNLTRVYAALNTELLSTSNIASFTIQSDLNGIPSGSNLGSGSIAVSFIDGSLSDSTYLSVPLQENQYYWVVFNSNENISVYYNDTLTSETSFKMYKNNDWTSYDDTINDIYYQLSLQIDVCDDYHKIKSPGIYSLVGERYIILRCTEIEENSFRSLSYSKYNLGIAKFRLGIVGYREERFDYSSVPNREFHPIGKLTRLSLRFETASGKLYDFKDVNHTITFSIQYLEPTGKVEFKKSLINTNYNGNFLEYQYTQQQQEEDSDDQDMDYNKDEFEKYKINEARNLPFQVAQRNLQMYYDLNYQEED